jgi:nitrate reductase gamma subunit
MDESNNWKTQVLVIGGVLGVIAGLGAAYIMIRRAEEEQTRPQIKAGDGVKIGMGLAGVFKLISDLGSK